MTTLDTIKNELIDRILATKNEKFLQAMTTIFESAQTEDIVALSSEQIEMLAMSEDDIVNGRLVSEEDLKASNPEWLR
jgi:archaellum component FlaF (FlaF/FlaG flagellin family)